MNWRTVLGLVFLLGGVLKMYQLIADNAAHRLSGNPLYAEIGCGVWMLVGVFLIIQGIKGKPR